LATAPPIDTTPTGGDTVGAFSGQEQKVAEGMLEPFIVEPACRTTAFEGRSTGYTPTMLFIQNPSPCFDVPPIPT